MRRPSTIPVQSALWFLFALLGTALSNAQGLTARAGLASNSVFVGEPIRFQIQVSGSETPEPPALPKLAGLNIKSVGGGTNSRRSVRIVNGRRTENVQLGYLFNYELRATKEGRLTIPAITVKADGKVTTTQVLGLIAQKPSETENYKLRVNLSKTTAYVGEQIVLEAVFYFRGEVAKPQLSLPIDDNAAFEVFEVEQERVANNIENLDGVQFRTGRMKKVLVPRRAGTFRIEPATLSFQGQDGTELGRDFFGRQVRRPKYKNFVIPSNVLDLTIAALPTAGRPANFAGHVGDYSLSVQASPTEVNVGDPITLNIAVAGPALLEAVKLPALHAQESLTSDFKVPSEIEDGTVNGEFKVFTQTVRALRDDVAAIPPIELPYFDTAKGTYQLARSEAIPLVVRATRIVTAGDAEGLGPINAAKQEIQAGMEGIAYNYTGSEVLAKQVLGLASPGRLALLAGPPLIYALLFGVVAVRRNRHANPELVRSRKALGEFQREVTTAKSAEDVLAAFRRFLGAKLALASDALTFRDVEKRLGEKDVAQEQLEIVKDLFAAGEASRFAGGGGGNEVEGMRERAVSLAKDLEKTL